MDSEGLGELFEPFGAISVRRMFGGHAVYSDGLCFALQIGGEVYIKSDDLNEAAFSQAGSEPFVYSVKGKGEAGASKPVKVGFWRLVASAYDDPEELKRWTELGLSAARRAAAAKAGKAAPKKGASKNAKSRATK
jgi:DNA transformation protein